MAFTFQVCDVVRATRPLAEVPLERAVQALLGTPVEACGAGVDSLVSAPQNAFLAAAWCAYAEHRPLVLTPDAVWLCLAQGFAAHVGQHAEALRTRLVVRGDDFRDVSADGAWLEVFAAFSQQLAEHIGPRRDLVVCDFSTTGPIERAASELVLMDAMQQYFHYEYHVICGIPEITLEGTVADWESVRRRAHVFAEYELEWWTSVLAPVLDEFVAAAEGRPDLAFWRHFFENSDGDGCGGGPQLHGWLLLLFPYVTGDAHDGSLRRNSVVTRAGGASPIAADGGPARWLTQASIDPESIPLGLSRAPLDWVGTGGTVHTLDLIGGFMGIAQDATTAAVRPAIGWAVRDHADAIRVRRIDSE